MAGGVAFALAKETAEAARATLGGGTRDESGGMNKTKPALRGSARAGLV
ncbi:Uncharacterized protein ChrSV_0408 [Chromobacterium vaccinii]|nr:Uncharacterized protein ChrSW_0408 [Chromobacterium vaccinii]QND87867.1 Uncharacterized protein ChrSV_0408 [Chromobacterium vaccinii]